MIMADLPLLPLDDWPDGFLAASEKYLEPILPAFLMRQRWFGDKARTIRSIHVEDVVRVAPGRCIILFILVRVEFQEGLPQVYLLPLTFVDCPRADVVMRQSPGAALARNSGKKPGMLCDALADADCCRDVLDLIGAARMVSAVGGGQVRATASPQFAALRGPGDDLTPRVAGAEQSNTSIVFGQRLIMKVFRRLEAGLNPELEIGRFLMHAGFVHIAPLVGAIEFQHPSAPETITLALVHGFVPNQGDAWSHVLGLLRPYLEKPENLAGEPPALADARLLGQRTAEMHLALAAPTTDPGFTLEPFSPADQQWLFQSIQDLKQRVFQQLAASASSLPHDTRSLADRLLAPETDLLERLRGDFAHPIEAWRMRVHADYHLGQVLHAGSDFVIIDFEGEPSRTLAERRRKWSPLKDVAGMIRSLHYAAHAGNQAAGGGAERENRARAWYFQARAAFLDAYRTTAARGRILPPAHADFTALLRAHLLEKAVYELGYELNHRPDWVRIPLLGILQVSDGEDAGGSA
jgi:trehalose synthase-fused probable maltokinase